MYDKETSQQFHVHKVPIKGFIQNPMVIVEQREYSTTGEIIVRKSKNVIHIASLTGIKNGV